MRFYIKILNTFLFQIYEYDVETEEYTKWTKQHCRKYPKQWLSRYNKIINIQQHPLDKNKIIFHDEQMVCVLDKSQVSSQHYQNILLKVSSSSK